MGISEGYVLGHVGRHHIHYSPCSKTNILVRNDGRACLTGFNLLTGASGQSTIQPLGVTGDRIPRLSPERLSPKRFGLKDSHPTMESDCYALGMVIYEVLSGRTPFFPCVDVLVVVQKILDGERPERPQGEEGARFTPGLWWMLELCWKAQPADRPSLHTVLLRLQDPMGIPPHTYPPGVLNRRIPSIRSLREGRVGRLAHDVRTAFKAVARRIRGT